MLVKRSKVAVLFEYEPIKCLFLTFLLRHAQCCKPKRKAAYTLSRAKYIYS
jgi:hypothetical protein